MSKIKAALESARKQREAARGDSSTATRTRIPGSQPSSAGGLLSVTNVPQVRADWQTYKTNRILTPNTHHPAEAAYRMLRTRLMQKMRSNGWRILGVSSLGQEEGKTFTAINLAISIAAEIGQEVVLVDLDLRRPSVYRYLGVDPSQFTNLSDYLQGQTDEVRNLLVCPGIERLGCILSATALDRPSDVLASPRGKLLFEKLRSRLPQETMVIVDLPPLLAVDDALAIAPSLDGLLLVVANGQAERAELVEARPLLEEFNLVGIVLNKSAEQERKSYYHYSH